MPLLCSLCQYLTVALWKQVLISSNVSSPYNYVHNIVLLRMWMSCQVCVATIATDTCTSECICESENAVMSELWCVLHVVFEQLVNMSVLLLQKFNTVYVLLTLYCTPIPPYLSSTVAIIKFHHINSALCSHNTLQSTKLHCENQRLLWRWLFGNID